MTEFGALGVRTDATSLTGFAPPLHNTNNQDLGPPGPRPLLHQNGVAELVDR